MPGKSPYLTLSPSQPPTVGSTTNTTSIELHTPCCMPPLFLRSKHMRKTLPISWFELIKSWVELPVQPSYPAFRQTAYNWRSHCSGTIWSPLWKTDQLTSSREQSRRLLCFPGLSTACGYSGPDAMRACPDMCFCSAPSGFSIGWWCRVGKR